jgi:hypothetical protein
LEFELGEPVTVPPAPPAARATPPPVKLTSELDETVNPVQVPP